MSQPEPLRDVIARHGLQASKALGQNFILDRQLLAKIAAVPGDIDGDTIYEVGPGPGGLTRALLERGARVVAVERDRRFAPALAELGDEFPGKLELVEADAL
ncbi:MAG: 16S rRNA (adenine(1518)-N(6)/adenine(1519)-N(6))-dimethyltransferase, partial [Sphingomonas sp.]|nr:16S rRNA (adenine(1518)-N(6)/adenine(1519)-N(6))-dimethyltransferase [Sphingomonas sp.]